MSLLRLLGPGWSHAVSTTVAVIVALYVAYALQLESPYSAATTVLVVASPIHGMVLAKSVYRFLGTLIGAMASVALVAFFAQTPELFILGASLWVGFFTAVSSLMRRFRAYGAVLAGYTVTLVAFGAVDQPLQIFDLAMARIAVVTIGIAASAVVTIALLPNTASADLPGKLRDAVRAMAELVHLALSQVSDETFAAHRLATAQKVQALATALYAASAENAAVAARSGYMRRAIAALFGLISAATALHQSPVVRDITRRTDAEPEEDSATRVGASSLGVLFERARDSFGWLAQDWQPGDQSRRWVDECRRDCADIQLNEIAANAQEPLRAMMALNRLDDLLEQGAILGESLRAYQDEAARPIDIRLPHHVDWMTALINGFRGMVAVLLLGAIWIYTAWPGGNQLFGVTIPFCALLAASDRQQSDTIAMFEGVVVAAIAAFICEFGLMTQIAGFPLLALSIAPFILLGSYCMTRPKMAMGATGFLIFFMTFLAPRNPMQFDMAAFLNNAFAFICGAACVLPIFRTIFPQNHWQSIKKLIRGLGRSLAQIAGRPDPSRLWQWEQLAYDRLAIIGTRLPLADRRRTQVMNGGFATIRIGREMVRAQSLLSRLTLDREGSEKVQEALRSVKLVARRPEAAGGALSAAADGLYSLVPSLPAEIASVLLRATASLRECADLILGNRDFFTVCGSPVEARK